MRILLVEDEKPLSAAIVKMLEQEHFALDAAYTGPDGLDCALSGIYDAIVLDVMLPGMDGFAVLRALRQQGASTPVRELALGDVRLNPEDAMLSCTNNGKSVRLAAKEYQLMELFLRNPHQLLPKETILERVWGFDNEAEYNNLSVYLTFLRRKLAFVGAHVEIRASRGLGYMLEETP